MVTSDFRSQESAVWVWGILISLKYDQWKCLSVDTPPPLCPLCQYFCPKDLLTLIICSMTSCHGMTSDDVTAWRHMTSCEVTAVWHDIICHNKVNWNINTFFFSKLNIIFCDLSWDFLWKRNLHCTAIYSSAWYLVCNIFWQLVESAVGSSGPRTVVWRLNLQHILLFYAFLRSFCPISKNPR